MKKQIRSQHKKWSESGLLLHSLSLGSILGFIGLFILTIWDSAWLNQNAINLTFMFIGVSFIIMSKVLKDRGRWIMKQLKDGVNTTGEVGSIVFFVLGLMAISIGLLSIFGIVTRIQSGIVATSSLIIIILLSVTWMASLRMELRKR